MKNLTKRTAFAGTFGAHILFCIVKVRIMFRQVRIRYRCAIVIAILGHNRLNRHIGTFGDIKQAAFKFLYIRAICCRAFGKNIQRI